MHKTETIPDLRAGMSLDHYLKTVYSEDVTKLGIEHDWDWKPKYLLLKTLQ